MPTPEMTLRSSGIGVMATPSNVPGLKQPSGKGMQMGGDVRMEMGK